MARSWAIEIAEDYAAQQGITLSRLEGNDAAAVAESAIPAERGTP